MDSKNENADCETCGGTGYISIGDDMIHHATMRDCDDCGGAGVA